MKKLLFILFFISLSLISESTFSLPVDSTVFQYYPLNAGNRWTWFLHHNFSPGDGYESSIILGTQVIKNHLYYRFRRDIYYNYGGQHYTGIGYTRVDSTTGNLYELYISSNDTNDCLIDSLNSSVNDSTHIGCINPDHWYRYSTGTYNIFSQTYPIKRFSYSTYFEGGDYHQYAKGIGYVYEFGQYVMSNATKTLRGCIINGIMYGDTTVYVGLNNLSAQMPGGFSLSQNYPNPFNPITNIKFGIPKAGLVKLTIFDVQGKELKELVNEELTPGIYNYDFNASELPSGVYYYKLQARDFTQTKKMVLIK